ncbi:MAG: dipeptide ABC transporter ATP-binding protein [Thermodesulfobacteriota bacterium]
MTPLLEAENLVKHFPGPRGLVRAVDGVSFALEPGRTVGLVGESGCGKSTVGRIILNLIPPTSGRLWFNGRNIYELKRAERRRLRREMGIVFQDPYSSLNPRLKVLDIVGEPLRTHLGLRGAALRDRVVELLQNVGLEPEHLHRFPHQFSGGQRQRLAISRSLALNPQFLVLDEPTSALDVSVQAQVLNLIRSLQKEKNLTYLFITHDLHVIRHLADRVMVMYLGGVVESGPVPELFQRPLHPYTQALLAAIPVADPAARRKRQLLEGEVPSPVNPPPGCRFHTRCPWVEPVCRTQEPLLQRCAGQLAACHRVHEELR